MNYWSTLFWAVIVPLALSLVLTLGGCAAQKQAPLTIDFTCISYAKPNGTLQTDCADENSWKAWAEKQIRERGI